MGAFAFSRVANDLHPTFNPPVRSPSQPPGLPVVVVALTLAVTLSLFRVPTAHAAPDAPPTPTVLTSFLPIHSLTLAIAGKQVKVENWLPAGVDPHDFQFSPRDLRRLRNASLLITGGLGLEGWTEPKLQSLAGNPALRLVEAAHGLPAEVLIQEPCGHDHEHDHDSDPAHHHAPNPHFWLDPVLMTHAATNILRALQSAFPQSAEDFARNAAATVEALNRLHADFSRDLADAKTPFITFHNAFPYLARRYNLRLVGVVESGATDQPSARQLSDLGNLVRREKASVLFMDGEPPRLARRLSSDLRLKLASLETLETGELGLDAYEKGMRRNLATLKTVLRGEPTP